MKVTRTSQVTKALRKAGRREELVRGHGYFYFAGGETGSWYATSVYVYRISAYTLEQWLEIHAGLAAPR